MFRELLESVKQLINEGFDLHGKSGNYFQRNSWTWKGMVPLIVQTEVLPTDKAKSISWNNGVFVTAEEANRVADALQPVVDKMVPGKEYVMNIRSEVQAKKMGAMGAPGYGFEKEDFEEFIEFSRKSNGFTVD